MSFKNLIANQVNSAFNILGTGEDGLAAVQTYIATAEGQGAYDPVTRTYTRAETRYEGVPMTLVRFKIDDMDDEVRPQEDRRALIPALRLPVTPTPQDRVEIAGKGTYTVVRLLGDPADAMYILHVRFEKP